MRAYLTPCPKCDQQIRCVPSIAFKVSGENKHFYTCPTCDTRLFGRISNGSMVLTVKSSTDQGEVDAARLMEQML